jgi:hypothetical protein
MSLRFPLAFEPVDGSPDRHTADNSDHWANKREQFAVEGEINDYPDRQPHRKAKKWAPPPVDENSHQNQETQWFFVAGFVIPSAAPVARADYERCGKNCSPAGGIFSRRRWHDSK